MTNLGWVLWRVGCVILAVALLMTWPVVGTGLLLCFLGNWLTQR